MNLHFPTEDEGDCYIIGSQGAPFEQIEAENSSMMKAEAGTASLSSGAASGGSQAGRQSVTPYSGTAGRNQPSSEAIHKNKKWTTPGGNGLLINDHQVALYAKGSKARISINFSGITISGSGDMELAGESIDLVGGDTPCLTIEAHAAERMSFQCGGSSIMLDGEDGKVHVRGDEVFLQSPLNPPPPDLPDEDEVERILAGYEEEKRKLRPVVLADGTIIDANNMDEQLLLDYFMKFVYDDPSDMASYDAFVRWRREVYGLTKKEGRWNYLRDSGEFIVKGNYSDKVTVLGIGGSIGLGLTGLDAPADVRDLAHNLTQWKWSWGHVGETALNGIDLIPVIGAVKSLKYADEAGALLKNADEIGALAKNADRVQEALKRLDDIGEIKYTDEFGNILHIRKVDNGFEILDSTGTVLRKTDNLDEMTDAVEALYKGTRNKIVRTATDADSQSIQKLYEKYNAGQGRNIATTKGQINGNSIDLESVSGKVNQSNPTHKVNFTMPTNNHYTSSNGRLYDSEQKMIESLREMYKDTPNISGEIEIISQRPVCVGKPEK